MKFNLDHSVNYTVARLAMLLKRQVTQLITEKNLDITPDQWVLLYYLWEEDGLTIGALSSKSKKDYANTTRIVDKLIKLGYVKKEKNKKDARQTHVYLQSKANNIKNDVQSCWESSSSIALKGITEQKQKELLEMLLTIENNITEAALKKE